MAELVEEYCIQQEATDRERRPLFPGLRAKLLRG
jgi:hypothetical protein